ncbi:hypothetical protein [Tardiphaga sp. vice154]|nr:hypothetical protein [Tardiphaga sp. vice154]
MFDDPDPKPYAVDAPPTWEDGLIAHPELLAFVLGAVSVLVVIGAAWMLR